MLPWALTDSQAKNIYNALYKWFNSPSNFPNYQTGAGVFFGYANYTLDKLYYTIEAAKKYYSLGWFTDNFEKRNAAIDKLSTILYDVFAGQVEKAGIKKFLTWIYNFAKQNNTNKSDKNYADAKHYNKSIRNILQQKHLPFLFCLMKISTHIRVLKVKLS